MHTTQTGNIKRCLQGIWFKSRESRLDALIFLYLGSVMLVYVRAVSAGLPNEYSVYDMYLWSLAKPENFLFLQMVLGLVLIPAVILSGRKDLIFLLRRRSKMEVWATNMVSILLAVLFAAAAPVGMSFFVTIFNREEQMRTDVTEFLTASFGELFLTPGQTVEGVSLGLFGNATACFLCTGLCFYLFLLFTGKKLRAACILFLIMAADGISCFSGSGVPGRLTFLGNVLPVCREGIYRTDFHGTYWVCVCGLLCFLTYRAAKSTDMLRTEKMARNSSACV